MTDIFLLGKGGSKLGATILRQLSRTYRVTYITENSFTRVGQGYELLFVEGCPRRIEGAKGAVLILDRDGTLPESLPPDCTAIISADSELQRTAVSRRGISTVVCGVSDTATVSFSSETDETLVVTLNRELAALSGKKILPLEIPVRKEGQDNDTLMRATALRLLLDDFDSELGKLY